MVADIQEPTETNMTETTKSTKQCFVISPIGEDESETRRRADQVLKHIIKPAALQCGYEAVRADEIDKPGLITSQIIQRVLNDDLVIADLTETNPNVFYELAIRHANRKPLVQIIEKGERIPFDVAGLRTVHVDHRDLDSVAAAKEEICRQISEIEKNPEDVESPISLSLELQKLRQSDDPDDRGMADLISMVSDLRSTLQSTLARNSSLHNDLTSRTLEIIEYLENQNRYSDSRRLRRTSPTDFRETIYLLEETDDRLGIIAFLASKFKDTAPWIYEQGLLAYRKKIESPASKYNDQYINAFFKSVHHFLRGPFSEENANSKSQMLERRNLFELFERARDAARRFDLQ